MTETYSTYEAKARLSEILRKVRGGQTILLSYHGKEVAEVRPIQREPSDEEALQRLEDRGLLQGLQERQGRFAAVAERPGALSRFLADRE